ncbi:MAG: DUF2505 domain-containing protein [Actinomycetaceae bacterium]|nr:DUF2505 domain-containing protein [Arcanobacterium sp.]MDD7505626.1 DUF2505 domain-containing protein [Actinomycetaceae bacterium]MDY6143404.1 DUF2505 domain-containing protein [Arcanobacterium sp.]
MKFSYRTDFPAPLDQVLDVLASEELAQRRADTLHINDYSFSSSAPAKGERTYSMTAKVGAERLPDQIRKFIKNGLSARIESKQCVVGADSATVEHAVSLTGAPVKLAFVLNLDEESGVTHALYEGEFNVNVPFVGKTIEQKAGGYVDDVIARDAKLVIEELR